MESLVPKQCDLLVTQSRRGQQGPTVWSVFLYSALLSPWFALDLQALGTQWIPSLVDLF